MLLFVALTLFAQILLVEHLASDSRFLLQNNKLIVDIAESKNELARLEDEILDLLSEAKGDILEDEHVIDTLSKTRETSQRMPVFVVCVWLIISCRNHSQRCQSRANSRCRQRRKAAFHTHSPTFSHTMQMREQYRSVATRGSVLYFVVADLARVDPMYQYSLLYFSNLFKSRIIEVCCCWFAIMRSASRGASFVACDFCSLPRVLWLFDIILAASW